MPSKDVAEKIAWLLDLCARSPAIDRVEEGAKHWKVFPADRSKAMHRIPHSPSDWRWFENQKSELRRIGVEMPRKGDR